MTVPILVPRRAGDPRRDALWAFCRKRWDGYTIIEGHHDDGPFNRSAAINRAAEIAGDWGVAVIADGDVVIERDQVDAAVARANETGRMVLAFTGYRALGREMTDRVLAGYDGSWAPGTKLEMRTHVSSCLAVPRALWDAVGGFDERFEGWGWEDQAFASACRVLGGGLEHVEGDVWHLWHEPSAEAKVLRRKNQQPPGLRAGEQLARQRYYQAVAPDEMCRLVAERAVEDGVLLVVVTDGRRDCIERAIASVGVHLTGPIVRGVICDDSADIEYQAWLRLRFPDFEVVCGRKRLGFGGNTARAWSTALGSGQRFVFWLEDDFELQRDVDTSAIGKVLDANPGLAQMALRRQAWFPKEIEAGGVVELNPGGYTDRHDGADWLEHREFYTTNPALIPRRLFAEQPWPDTAHSEARFAKQLFADPDARCGYWGLRDDEPWVIHDGQRQGTGY